VIFPNAKGYTDVVASGKDFFSKSRIWKKKKEGFEAPPSEASRR
jgi:hypothetical protein